jgi:hypothetical protein
MTNEIKSEDFYADTMIEVLRDALQAVRMSEDTKISLRELDAIVSEKVEGDDRWLAFRDAHNAALYEVLTERVEATLKDCNLLRAA